LGFARAALRGGNWNNGTNAGVFALNLNNTPSNLNSNIGFRACKYFSQNLAEGLGRAVHTYLEPQSLSRLFRARQNI